MATTAERTIIETPTPGWFLDPASGKKTRKQEGDRIMSQAEYDQALLDADPAKVTPPDPQEQVEPAKSEHNTEAVIERINANAEGDNTGTPAEDAEAKRQQQVKDAAAEVTVLTSGKVVTGKTVTIKCSHIDGVLHEKHWADLTAAEKRKACGDERTIKVQDQFQVKRCVAHQKAHRNALKRQKTRDQKAAREAAREAAKANSGS